MKIVSAQLLSAYRRGCIHECPLRAFALVQPDLKFSIDDQDGTLGTPHPSGNIANADLRVCQESFDSCNFFNGKAVSPASAHVRPLSVANFRCPHPVFSKHVDGHASSKTTEAR